MITLTTSITVLIFLYVAFSKSRFTGNQTVKLEGRKYKPLDNSYSYCLTDKEKYYLAGTSWMPAEIVEIVSDPYEELTNELRPDKYKTFINVRCRRGLTHRVLYYGKCIQ